MGNWFYMNSFLGEIKKTVVLVGIGTFLGYTLSRGSCSQEKKKLPKDRIEIPYDLLKEPRVSQINYNTSRSTTYPHHICKKENDMVHPSLCALQENSYIL